MATLKLKGPGLNCWFAEQLVKDHGPDGARDRCSGPMLAAVEAVIAEMNQAPAKEPGEQNGGAT
jgi:hypothetical protein